MNAAHDNELMLAVVIGTIVFFILVAFCISYFVTYTRKRNEHETEISEFRKQFENQLLQSRIEVQEQTFQQIGKDLHDNIGQLLSSAKMLLGLAERELADPPDTLLTANETLGDAIVQLRELSRSLDKDWLERFDFAENLRMEITRINAGRRIEAVYNQEHEIPLAPHEQMLLFRIVQEAVQNAVKHAQPGHITIRSYIKNDIFYVSITDDGNGIDLEKKRSGMGMSNMKHRTALLQGNIAWDAIAENGTCVTITLPANKQHI